MVRSFVWGLILTLWLSAPVNALEVDHWLTGQTRQEMEKQAQQLNLPIARESVQQVGNSFDKELVQGEATRFYYQTTLYQRPATVYLSFSPAVFGDEQRLFGVEAVFRKNHQQKDVLPYLTLMLMEAYGTGRIFENFFEKQMVWNPGINSEVQLIDRPSDVRLKYTDFEMKARAGASFSFDSSGASCGDLAEGSVKAPQVACMLDLRNLH